MFYFRRSNVRMKYLPIFYNGHLISAGSRLLFPMIPEVTPFAPPPKLVQKVQIKVAPFEPEPATRTAFVTCNFRDANAKVAERCRKVQKLQRREQSSGSKGATTGIMGNSRRKPLWQSKWPL